MLSKAVIVGIYQRKLEELARLPGVELTVIAPSAWRDSRGAMRLERAFTRGYRLLETPLAFQGHYHTHFYPQLGHILDAVQPEIVHVDEEPYNLATWQAMRWATQHSVPALFFTWQNLVRRYPPPFRWIESYCYAHAAHAIAGNQSAAGVLTAKGYRGPISVIPQFGVDPDLFTWQRPEHRPSQGLVIGYAGGLVPEKGVDTLLRAVALCCQRDWSEHGPTSYRLRIAGTGPDQAMLAGLAAQLGLTSQVEFLGRVASAEMPEFYRNIDVLVLPSRTTRSWKEQFGRVLVEAMASGVPVVGSDSGEIPHVIGDSGIVFPEGDVAALASLLARLAADPGQRATLAARGRARALARFTQRRIAEATYAVYLDILTSGIPAAESSATEELHQAAGNIEVHP
jgi:glycosyltransferase involved in cell wall biosynthesis